MKKAIEYLPIAVVVLFLMGLVFYLYKKNRFSRAKTVRKPIEYVDTHLVINDQVIDAGDVYEIIDPLYSTVNINDGEREYNDDLQNISVPQKYIFAICCYRAEVNNGGHDQFYFNSTGIVWEDALRGFREIGLLDFYNILKESTQRMGGYPSKNRNDRQDQLSLSMQTTDFDDLDRQYYELEGKSDMDLVLLEYIKKNRQCFYFNGVVKRLKV